jgi:hypothetical protein
MGGNAKERIVLYRRAIAVENDWQIAPSRRLADRPDKFRVAIVSEHHIGRANHTFRIVRPGGGDALVAIGYDGAIATRVHEDCRQRSAEPVYALTGGAIDVLAR